MKDFFAENIEALMTNLIIPNIGITKTTVDLFNEEPSVFIDYYFKNIELQTRRAGAI